ncbi:hypothetical protein QWM81_12825 [Streptomyces ficellus]|uniref:DUF320 domain-containing protein n=1 Tax=Streptomyces ficellus TaxID=1977088 RepID=A0ABT7Z5Z5_9ACTN|nr:hypothetical protein [Streptomyces ficellus]MDN3294919.1 hypothetical protein [Streptomyces ficellus]
MISTRILAATAALTAALALPLLGAGTAHAVIQGATNGVTGTQGNTVSYGADYRVSDSGDAKACGDAKVSAEGTNVNEKECVSTP